MPVYRLPPFKIDETLLASDLTTVIDRSLTIYGVPQAWTHTRGEGVTVAVLDTGVDVDHPDLAQAVVEAEDFTGSSAGSGDRVGHGTHCSGTIGARGRLNGVAPACRLIHGKVLGDDGSGMDPWIAGGINWAVAHGADVISGSFGSNTPSPIMAASIRAAVAQGKFFVFAAGNDHRVGGGNEVDHPAKLRQGIAVAAVDENNRIAPFSSRGPEVDIAAPGVNILSTYPGGGYARMSGTSMATPFVAGVVALCLAKHRKGGAGRTPLDTIEQLKKHLSATATDAGAPGFDVDYGFGLIAPGKLIDAVSGPADPPAPLPVDVMALGDFAKDGRMGQLLWRASA